MTMRKVPCDIGAPQEEFEDIVCGIFDDPNGDYEILDRNEAHDPFEPDLVIMDSDEWVFNVLCYFVEDYPSDGFVEIFPETFGMRKWVQDDSEKPTFLALGVGGTPSNPDCLYFTRFFHFTDSIMDLKDLRVHMISWLRYDFLDKVVRDNFELIYSPN